MRIRKKDGTRKDFKQKNAGFIILIFLVVIKLFNLCRSWVFLPRNKENCQKKLFLYWNMQDFAMQMEKSDFSFFFLIDQVKVVKTHLDYNQLMKFGICLCSIWDMCRSLDWVSSMFLHLFFSLDTVVLEPTIRVTIRIMKLAVLSSIFGKWGSSSRGKVKNR